MVANGVNAVGLETHAFQMSVVSTCVARALRLVARYHEQTDPESLVLFGLLCLKLLIVMIMLCVLDARASADSSRVADTVI